MITPNYSPEIEQRVLETLMHYGTREESKVQKAMLTLRPDTFYRVEHKMLFAMISNAFKANEPFDFITMLSTIPADDNQLYMTTHTLLEQYGQMPPGVNYLETDVVRLNTLMRLRKQIDIAQKMIEEVSECRKPEDAEEILSSALTSISGLSYREDKNGITNIEISEAFCDGEVVEAVKIPTACDQLNQGLGGGIISRCLYFIAAAPSVGKTGFSIFLMDAIARTQLDTHSLFFSLEMEYKHIWMRHIGICAGKPFDKLNHSERMAAVTKAMQVPMTIYDTAMTPNASDLDFIMTTARIKAMDKKISVIVVDYLDLIRVRGKFERNDLKIDEITSQLRQLAIELDCTVILLSQINRGAANRGEDDRCPWPHDAANGSGGHKNSSIWLGLDRPALYKTDDESNNQFIVKCRKNRFGDIFELLYGFNGGTFGDYIHMPVYRPFSSRKTVEQQVFD